MQQIDMNSDEFQAEMEKTSNFMVNGFVHVLWL
jgi:hypothetical protein